MEPCFFDLQGFFLFFCFFAHCRDQTRDPEVTLSCSVWEVRPGTVSTFPVHLNICP